WWYLVEVIGFVLIPCFLFARAVTTRNVTLVKIAAIATLIGIILNRLNVSIIAFNWTSANPYYPSIAEIVITLMVIFTEIWVFRWIVNRMPVLRQSPFWANEQQESDRQAA
ncbi:MAG: hypothetical protein QNL88_00865, partial [Acidobacteriota bacterium]|nr:hypothetical protein [Acidobacteriota bacterium]